ncbi:hypothetical protein F4604DRAFT_1936429 [Suillus subluteus]|nr:hypothetical protein F4604DRAFT_1936429 [Suillus subluteus]
MEKKCRIFTEWMTGNDAWDMQPAIPSGTTLLGTILSSDKTNITSLTGDRVAHSLTRTKPVSYMVMRWPKFLLVLACPRLLF